MAIEDIVERFEAGTTIKENSYVSFFEMLTPGFIGGIIIGILAGIPGLSLLIFLFPLGGYYAAKLVKEYYEKKINATDAAKVGAFAGFLGGFFSSLILLTLSIFFADSMFSFFTTVMGSEKANFVMLLSGIDPYISLYNLRLRFLANIVLCTVLGAIGGIIFVIREKRQVF
jgi:hypothetical protein